MMKKILSLLISTLFLFAIFFVLQSCDYGGRLAPSKKRQKELSEKIDSLKLEHKKLDEKFNALEEELNKRNQHNDTLVSKGRRVDSL